MYSLPFQFVARGRSLLVCGFLSLLLLPGTWLAARDHVSDTEESRPFSLTYHQENDGPWPNPFDGTDRYYTHGIALSVTHQPEWAKKLADLLPFGGGVARPGAGYLFAHEMYTPEDLSQSELITEDRPYAGYAYLGVAHQRASRGALDHLQLDVGAIGPITQADRIQSYAHEAWGGRDPRGWHNQLENETTVQLMIERRWRLETGGRFGMQLIPATSIDLGTVLGQIRLGTTLRVGFNLPDDFGPSRFGVTRQSTAEPQPGLGLFGFAGAAGRLVSHNRLISGNEHLSTSGRSIESLLGELSLGGGVVLRFGSWSLEANYAQLIVTPQFRGQEGRHRYGSARFTIAGPYVE